MATCAFEAYTSGIENDQLKFKWSKPSEDEQHEIVWEQRRVIVTREN